MIAAKLNDVFRKIQAVDSVFAASTLPVSVNVRGTYLNQVYMGVFRPDQNASPRWPGNLKQYKLTGSVEAANTLSTAWIFLNTSLSFAPITEAEVASAAGT